MIGTTLAHYRITAALGAGGMGEVWRATDEKLGREVALKVLPQEFAEDPDRMARFEREAKVLASLNHPNIAHLYGLENSVILSDGASEAAESKDPLTSPESHPSSHHSLASGDPSTWPSDGLAQDDRGAVTFLVMELVVGEDLSERIARGAIPVNEAIPIALQIAEALEAAHEQGIVHRDLKPANIKITDDGTVKVLDFGLAKAWEAEGTDLSSSFSPTITRHATLEGVILGTAAYMSPEQARGKRVDRRADIWAFGVVLWEMLTGRKLFDGETVSDVMASILTKEPDLDELPDETPSHIRDLIGRCLRRDPKVRQRDMGDARITIDEPPASGVGAGDEVAVAARGGRAMWLVGACILAAGLLLGWLLPRGPASPDGIGDTSPLHAELEIGAPDRTTLVSGMALSPDGQKLAFVARGDDGGTDLWIRDLAAREATMLPGTNDARYPFWSPDSRSIGFFAQNRLKVTQLFGGQPRIIAETGSSQDARGGAWGAGDVILFAPSFVGPIRAVAASGGEVTAATEIDGQSGIGTHRFPSFLPDGKRFLFYGSAGTGVEPGTLWLGEIGSLDSKPLGPSSSTAVWAPPGYVLYVTGDSLVAHRYDDLRNELVDDPVPLGISLAGTVAVSGQRSLTTAAHGLLAYRDDKRNSTRVVVADRSGIELEALTEETNNWYYAPRLAPDGRRVVVSHYEAGSTSGGLWLHDLDSNLESQLTFGTGDDLLSAWSPDGREVAYSSVDTATGSNGIFRIAVDSAGQGRKIFEAETFSAPDAWTPDGKRLIFWQSGSQGGGSLWIRSLEANPDPRRLGRERSTEWSSALSPDGRWLAYCSDAARRWDVYVRALDGPGGEVRISTEGGFAPSWRRDGGELFFVDLNGRMMAVPVQSLDPPSFGPPAALFDARLEEAADRQYDVFPDGQRFLLNRSNVEAGEPIVIVLGWTARLKNGVRP